MLCTLSVDSKYEKPTSHASCERMFQVLTLDLKIFYRIPCKMNIWIFETLNISVQTY